MRILAVFTLALVGLVSAGYHGHEIHMPHHLDEHHIKHEIHMPHHLDEHHIKHEIHMPHHLEEHHEHHKIHMPHHLEEHHEHHEIHMPHHLEEHGHGDHGYHGGALGGMDDKHKYGHDDDGDDDKKHYKHEYKHEDKHEEYKHEDKHDYKHGGGDDGGDDGGHGHHYPAAILSHHKVTHHDVHSHGHIHPVSIDVPANILPVNFLFRSASAIVHVTHKHEGAKGSFRESHSKDDPHIIVHKVEKPIIQEVHEVISPYRKITQTIEPVKEEIMTKVAKSHHKYGHGMKHDGRARA